MSKYNGPEFNDPVVRCVECQKLIFKEAIQMRGKCPQCGCRKVRNVMNLTQSEHKLMIHKGVDPEFLILFEEAVNE
jgi:phage FluMu protein Com